jgi:hypothetical protein
MNKKSIHISALISVYSGCMVCTKERGIYDYPITGVYEVCDFMSGESNFTHQLPRIADEVRPYLREQFPWLIAYEKGKMPDFARGKNGQSAINAHVDAWIDVQIAKHGEWFDVIPMHPEDHASPDLIQEFREMAPDAKLIIIHDEPDAPSPTGDINWKS